jgi:hypothetical protein
MKITILSFSLMALLFTFSTQTFAVDFTVNLTTDQHDASTADGICDIDLTTAGLQCSLRAAVEQANNLGSNDRVLFNLQANSTILLTTTNGGEIPITNNGTLEIIGTGANNLTIDGGAGINRIFSMLSTIVNVSAVTITGGNGEGAYPSGYGGAILAHKGSLTLNSVHITGNAITEVGGGVDFFTDELKVVVPSSHLIINSTFSSNTANSCGGFRNTLANVTVVNSTVSSNAAIGSGVGYPGGGGGICATGGITTLRNVTVTNNTAGFGGGIFKEFEGTLNLGNTLVAGNTGTLGAPEIYFYSGTITSAGGNLVGDSPGDSTNTGLKAITYQSSDIRDTNPMLGALTLSNGGPTPTHALLPGSPALDTGINSLVTEAFDQRGTGFLRIVDGDGNGTAIVDIGAFEVQACGLIDTDSDGIGNDCDSDDDNDNVIDEQDAFPLDPNESVDTDSDGIGNNADTDDDNDGQSDVNEIACGSNPLDAASKCPPSTTGPPTNINQCKNGRWRTFTIPRTFKNQGDCIQFVNTGK